MKNYTKTFRRFTRKHTAKGSDVNTLWQLYLKGGKSAVLIALGKQAPKITDNVLVLPPSMPKGAASKILAYMDSREKGGDIQILLKGNLKFENGSDVIRVSNVKQAIEVMRKVG